MTTKNKVKYGLKNAHYAPITIDAEGSIVFATPIKLPGAVSISLSASGDKTTFYADGEEYFSDTANDGYDGDLELALIPDAFKTEILGEVLDSNKVLIEKNNVQSKPFALLFEFEGDVMSRKHVMYYCKSSRTSIESSTKTNSKEVKTETLTLSARNLPGENTVKASTNEATTEAVLGAWYSQVYQEPTVAS